MEREPTAGCRLCFLPCGPKTAARGSPNERAKQPLAFDRNSEHRGEPSSLLAPGARPGRAGSPGGSPGRAGQGDPSPPPRVRPVPRRGRLQQLRGISPAAPPPPPPHTPTHSSPSLLPGTPQRSAFAACAAPARGGVSAFSKIISSIFSFFPFFSPSLRSGPSRSSSSRRRAEQGGWPGGASRGCSSSCVSTAATGRDTPPGPRCRDTDPCRDVAGTETDPALLEPRGCFTRRGLPRRYCPLCHDMGRPVATGGLSPGAGLGGAEGCCLRSAPLCPQTPRLAWLPSKKLKTCPGSPLTPKRTFSSCGKTGRRA